MTLECARQRKFTELVANHVFVDVHRHMLLAIVHRDCQTNKVWEYSRTTGPGFNWTLVFGRCGSLYFFNQVGVAERTFFNERDISVYPT